MRILVTGVTGQIGRALLSRLQKLGTIIAADRATLDLARPQTVAEALNHLAPDIIVNPAAYTAVDKAEKEHDLAMLVNGSAPGTIARWAASHAVPLIHFSTDYVFDGSGERPWREDDPVHPLSVYGMTKLAGENEIRSAGGSFLIVRTSWVYAAQGNNFLNTIARLACERRELRVVADQFGAPTSADMIARMIATTVESGPAELRQLAEQADGLVHLSASGETSWFGFARAIVEGLKARGLSVVAEHVIPTKTDEYPTLAKRPLNSRLDMTRLHKVFNTTLEKWESALGAELDEYSRKYLPDRPV